MAFDAGRTTELLQRFAGGDAGVQEQLYLLVCEQLRGIAGAMMKAREAGHTLQPTALVHEAWIRLVRDNERIYSSRWHFVSVAAKAMRSVLVDHVRKKRSQKRGGQVSMQGLDGVALTFESGQTDLLDLEAALKQLEGDDPDLARLVELRFFAGLTHAEIAELLDVSVSTIERQWRIARAFLHGRIAPREGRNETVD
jgi:RNA polymerase sigma factor (TIGR02999 family)